MKSFKSDNKKIKLGIVANEFFDLKYGGVGGFGWATRQVAKLFNEHPEHGVAAVFLNRTLEVHDPAAHQSVNGIPLIARTGGRVADIRRLRAEKIDLLLMIDYRPAYRFFAAALPRTPIIVWMRDPKTEDDERKIRTLRIPGAENVLPQGTNEIDCTSLGKIAFASAWLQRPILFATTARELIAKARGYGVQPAEVTFLPNAVDPFPGEVVKSPHPRVVFLGRLDPIKRPWLFSKLAERFPQVEFLFMGPSHFKGAGAWSSTNPPDNVKLMGHVDGAEKWQALSSAWALINTSIHEGLAVSFLEALACETPLISCQNPEDVVSRFGYYVGRWDGDGLDALPHFSEALDRLLQDTETRTRLGKEGRAWVTETHNPTSFLSAFHDLCSRLKLE